MGQLPAKSNGLSRGDARNVPVLNESEKADWLTAAASDSAENVATCLGELIHIAWLENPNSWTILVNRCLRYKFLSSKGKSTMPRYHVQRSIEINASPQKVFEVVSDFGTWTTWSPWLCAEPDANVTVTDDAASIGSVYSWEGELVGQGEIEHQTLTPGKLIEDEIRFVKPFRSRSEVCFEMEPAGDGTKLTWHMRGSLPWFLFWMRAQMEVFIGMDYERGLRMLKEWIESGQILSKTNIRGVESVGPLRMAGVRKKCSISDVGSSMEGAFSQAKQILSQHNIRMDEGVMSVYHHFDMKAKTFDYTSGFVVPQSADLPAELATWSIPSAKALCVEHTGSYDNLGNGWSAAHQYARYKKLKQSKAGTFEVYRNDPDDTAAADLVTEIYLPLK